MAEDSLSDVYKKFDRLTEELTATRIELAKTQTMIRDYNGLREKQQGHDDRITALEGTSEGLKKTLSAQVEHRFGFWTVLSNFGSWAAAAIAIVVASWHKHVGG